MPLRLPAAALALVALLACAAPAAADDPPDPRAILQRAAAALREARAVRYEAEARADGPLAARYPPMRGRIVLAAGSAASAPLTLLDFELSAQDDRPAIRAQLASDGREVTLIDHAQKLYLRRPLPAGAPLLLNASPLLVGELVAPRPFERELAAVTLTHAGTATVAGSDCDVIDAVYAADGGAARWYIARSDHLPRRIARTFDTPRGPGSITTSLSGLTLLSDPADVSFRLTPPADYRDADQPPVPAGTLAPGAPAPDWTLRTADGRQVSLRNLRGKIVLLDFWATWCGPCHMVMPHLQRLHEKYRDRPVAVFGINCLERSRNADPAAFVRARGITYPQLLDGDPVAAAYGVHGLPTLVLIDADGKVLLAQAGFSPGIEARIAPLIDAALATLATTSQPAAGPPAGPAPAAPAGRAPSRQ